MAKSNGKSLVIVESPAKSKTIKKILGDNFEIEASYGHVRDFPKKVLGFDVDNGFLPTFEVIKEKEAVVKKLNSIAKKADKVYLASDPDREGEAIAWHVRDVLKVPDDKIYRIVFNEITPTAVRHAVDNPGVIDIKKVEAQQTRQILDRLVGYKISPVLWSKLRNNRLSAGRVQSVALRMIVEREQEIDAFVPIEYWSVDADLKRQKFEFNAELTKYKNKKIEIKNKKEVEKVQTDLEKAEYTVGEITHRDTQRKPSAPFITSTLQREASNKLGYGVSKTMQIAQKLYEGIEIEGEPIGLITYMRTDSVRISDDAQKMAKDYILENYGKEFYPKIPNDYAKSNKKKNVQDAHEAIRPSYINKTPESIKQYLTSEQYRLYKLIWSRFLASQMENAKVKNISVDILANDYTLKVGTAKVVFEGFLKVYCESEEEVEISKKIPDFKTGEKLDLIKVNSKQHFTQPPPRFTEASLVKQMEEYGIGRPSTYAPIISKIQTKNYVEKIEKSLAPTLLGKTVCTQLIEHFKDVMDYKFTAGLESKLDEIAEDNLVWNDVIKEFYEPFIKVVDSAKENMQVSNIESKEICPNCGKPMLVKMGRGGSQFLACSGYPDCKTILPMANNGEAIKDEPTDEKCAKCGSEMVKRQGPYGPYYQCLAEKSHKQKIIISTGIKCPREGCDGEILQRKGRFNKIFYGCSKYPDCNQAFWYKPINEKCPKCGSLLIKKFLKRGNTIACSKKECDYKRPMTEAEEQEG